MEFTTLSEQEFAAFADTHPLRSFWQTPQMAHVREKRGFHTEYVGVKDEGKIIAAAMLSELKVFLGYTLVQALRGFLIDYEDSELLDFFHHELIRFLKARKCMILKIDPYYPYVQRDLNGERVAGGFDHSDVVEHLKRLGYHHLGFTRGIDLDYEPRWIYTVPYRGMSADELLKSFERKTVRSIRKAEKYHVSVRELKADQIDLFIKVMEHTEDRRGFEGRSKEYYEQLYQEFAPKGYIKFLYAELKVDDYIADLEHDLSQERKTEADCLKKLEVNEKSHKIRTRLDLAQEQIRQLEEKIREAQELKRTDGEVLVLSSCVWFTYGRESLCLLSGVYDKYMKFASPYAMHWKMMQEGIAKGQERYNLYGTSGIFDPDAPDYGVYLFKKGFQGEIEELVGDFHYVIHPTINHIYDTLRGIKHKLRG